MKRLAGASGTLPGAGSKAGIHLREARGPTSGLVWQDPGGGAAVRVQGLRGQRGQSVVELALVLPVLLLLLLGMVDFGRLGAAYLSLQHAAREGVRLGITGATDGEIAEQVRDAAAAVDVSRLTISIGPPEAERFPGADLTIELGYPFRPLTPFVERIVGSEATLRVRLVSRVE